MKRQIRIKHRAVEGILASVVGGTFVAAAANHSRLLALVGVLVGIALLIEEKADEEESE